MITYKDAGVDVERGYEAVRRMKQHVAATFDENVLGGLGSFGAGFGGGFTFVRCGCTGCRVAGFFFGASGTGFGGILSLFCRFRTVRCFGRFCGCGFGASLGCCVG